MSSYADHTAIASGDSVPALERTITLVDMIAYAGATWDFYKSHYDPGFVAEARLPAPIVDGQVFGALLVEQLQDWLGPLSFVQELAFTFKNLVFAGETVRCEGEVSALVTDENVTSLTAELRVVVVADDGSVDRVAVAGGRAVVLLGRADGLGASA